MLEVTDKASWWLLALDSARLLLVLLSVAPAPADRPESLRSDAALLVARVHPFMQAIGQRYESGKRLTAVGRAVASVDAASKEKPYLEVLE